MHNRKAVTKVLYHVFVILFGFMMVYPVLWMISGSFKGNAEILRGTLSLIPKELKRTWIPELLPHHAALPVSHHSV